MNGITDIFGNRIEIGDLVASTNSLTGGYTRKTKGELAIYEVIGFTPQKVRLKLLGTDKITTKFDTQICLGRKYSK